MSNATKEAEISKSDQEENKTVAVSTSSTSTQGGCTRCCRQTLTFLASTLGLTVLTVAYSALGGYIFMVLESPAPTSALDQSPTETVSEMVAAEPGLSLDRRAVRESLSYHLERLWNATEDMNVIYRDSWARLAEGLLLQYADDVFEAVRVNGTAWDAALEGTNHALSGGGCPPKHVESNQWSYPGSLLYAITVVTTIGKSGRRGGFGNVFLNSLVSWILEIDHRSQLQLLNFKTVRLLG